MMKMNKKLMIVLLMALGVSQGLSAQLSKSPSLFARACSYVPFKSTLGLGLGLMAASAYCAYKLPQLEAQLQKAQASPYRDKPVKPKSLLRDVKAERKVIDQVQQMLKEISKTEMKNTPDNKATLQKVKALFKTLTLEDNARDKVPLIIDIIIQEINVIGSTIEAIKTHHESHNCSVQGCEQLKTHRETLADCPSQINKQIKELDVYCDVLKKQLDEYSKSSNYKALLAKQKAQDELYQKEVKKVNVHNRPIAIARTTLANAVSSYKNLRLNFCLSGITVAFLAGISKYFSR